MLANVAVTMAETVVPKSAEEAVAVRQALMKLNGQTLRSAGGLTGPDAEVAMQTLIDNFTQLPVDFPKDSIVGDSEALPLIWDQFDDFTAISTTGRTAAEAGLAAAKAGDATAYAVALRTIGGTCGTCHMTYRAQ